MTKPTKPDVDGKRRAKPRVTTRGGKRITKPTKPDVVPESGDDVRTGEGRRMTEPTKPDVRGKLRRTTEIDVPFQNRGGLRPIVPNGHAKSVALAHLLSVVSAWAYADEVELIRRLESLVPGEKFEVMPFGTSNNALFIHAMGYLIRIRKGRKIDRDTGIVCFQGTDWKNTTSWLVDANVRTTQVLDMGSVHGGFARNVAAIYKDMEDELQKIVPSAAGVEEGKLQDLYFTGHSLGGGMAALAAARLWNSPDLEWRKRIRSVLRGLHTFGQPKVGDPTFARSCDESELSTITYRYVYKNDIVPRFPPRSTGKFEHFGKGFVCGERGWVRASQPLRQLYTGILSNLIGLLPAVFETFTFTRRIPNWLGISWPDHSPLNYIWCSQVHECSEPLL